MNKPDINIDEAIFLDSRQREIEPVREAIGFSRAVVKDVDKSTRSVAALVSTPSVDRYEEIVEPSAFKAWLPVFKENPVMCAGHQYIGPSGETTVIGSWPDLEITKEGLLARCTFGETELAENYWKNYRDGHQRAFSVGWITHEWEMREFELEKGVKVQLRVFTEVELIEISAVAIPANRDALVRAASAGMLRGVKVPGVLKECEPPLTEARLLELLGESEKRQQEFISKHFSMEPGSKHCTELQDIVADQLRGLGHTCGEHDVTKGGASDVDVVKNGLQALAGM